MRSSKSRSRSKQNRPRTLGNIINRVFDSSGPEGKVRGTPQQIIEKYNALARDAQLSNDRVAAENFLQHAEHYTRLLAEAQREMAAEQEARQQFHQQNQNGNGNRDRQNGNRDDRGDRGDYRGDQPADDFAPGPEAFDVVGGDEDGHLVDLPEAPRPAPQQQPRRDDYRRDDNRRRDDGNRRRDPQQGEARSEQRPEPRGEQRPPRKVDIVVKSEAPAPEAAAAPAPAPAPAPVAAEPAATEAPAKPAPKPRTRRPAAPKAAKGDTPEAAE